MGLKYEFPHKINFRDPGSRGRAFYHVWEYDVNQADIQSDNSSHDTGGQGTKYVGTFVFIATIKSFSAQFSSF